MRARPQLGTGTEAWHAWADEAEAEIDKITTERDLLMLQPASRLDGYRELGSRAARAENENDTLRKRVETMADELHTLRYVASRVRENYRAAWVHAWMGAGLTRDPMTCSEKQDP